MHGIVLHINIYQIVKHYFCMYRYPVPCSRESNSCYILEALSRKLLHLQGFIFNFNIFQIIIIHIGMHFSLRFGVRMALTIKIFPHCLVYDISVSWLWRPDRNGEPFEQLRAIVSCWSPLLATVNHYEFVDGHCEPLILDPVSIKLLILKNTQ